VRQAARSTLKALFHRYGFDIVRVGSPVSTPDSELEFPVDFDEETKTIVRRVRNFTMTSDERLFVLCEAVRYLAAGHVPGDIVECGVWKGGSMMAAAMALLAIRDTSRDLYLFDTFEGMPKPSEHDIDFAGVSELEIRTHYRQCPLTAPARAGHDEVRRAMLAVGYPAHKIHLVKGLVEKTLPRHAPAQIALLRLDTDYYESTRHELVELFPRLSTGGVLIIDDYGHFAGAKKAVDEYFQGSGPRVFLTRIDYSARVAVKLPL
jgi:O-methyltransferase